MSTIKADYTAMDDGRAALLASWNRIEQHLGDLDRAVAATHDMTATTLTAYQGMKAKWSASADDRQQLLCALADAVEQASNGYRQVDLALAAQFAG